MLRASLGLIVLLVALAVVGKLVKTQLSSTGAVTVPSIDAEQEGSGDTLSIEQGRQLQQQVQEQLDQLMQQRRMPEELD